MHISFITRGDRYRVKKFIEELDAKILPFKWKGKDGGINVSVRPIQLWEVVFPEEHKELMLNTLFDKENYGKFPKHQSKYQKMVYPLRKALRLNPIPKKWESDQKLILDEGDVQRIAIGMKEDVKDENGEEQI